MGDFYINWGRWADTICGPFDSEHEAKVYAAQTAANNPTIVQIAPPLKRWVFTWQVDGVDFSASVKDRDVTTAKERVAWVNNMPTEELKYAGREQ